MTPIQQDPARRIRRIQRLQMLPGERFTEAMGCVVCSTLRAETMTEYRLRRLREMRLAKVATAANREIDWLCSYALDTESAFVARGAMVSILEAAVDRNRKTIAENKARIEELEGRIANALS